MDDGRHLEQLGSIEVARQVCFILSLLAAVEAGEFVSPGEAAMLSRLSPDFLEFLADLVTEPAPCIPPAGSMADTLRSPT